MKMLCPWSGLPCDCQEFPWLVNGLVPKVCEDRPKVCEDRMPDAILGIRKVSEDGINRYKKYLTELVKPTDKPKND